MFHFAFVEMSHFPNLPFHHYFKWNHTMIRDSISSGSSWLYLWLTGVKLSFMKPTQILLHYLQNYHSVLSNLSLSSLELLFYHFMCRLKYTYNLKMDNKMYYQWAHFYSHSQSLINVFAFDKRSIFADLLTLTFTQTHTYLCYSLWIILL